MDGVTFFGLRRAEAPLRWEMDVVRHLCSGMGTIFGGVGVGALLEALEHDSGRPAIWATAQYLAFARPPETLEIEVVLAVEGNNITQGRAVGRVDGREILTVNAALGHRDIEEEGQWADMPQVPPPDECPERRLLDRHQGTIADRIDTRIARGRQPDDLPAEPGDGRAALWVRIPDLPVSTAALSVIGDYVPFGISQSLGKRAGGNSLDNTVRIACREPTDWILADVRIHAIRNGFAHGLVHLWTEDGTLLATASQSAVVRAWKEGSR